MTDYTKSTGSSGTMLIRDTGTYVEFWLKAGSATYAYQLPWGLTVNGVTDNNNEFRFVSGGAYQRLGSWRVTTDQTVTFRIYDSGTSGIGGPTTHSAFINRASVPDPPSTPTVSSIGSTSVTVTFSDGSNNGSGITSRRIGYGTNPTSIQTLVWSDRSTVITGLTPGTTYYFWAQTYNYKGWSAWSGKRAATTLKVPPAPTSVILSGATQVSVNAKFSSTGTGGSPVVQWQLGYGLSAATPQLFLTSTGTSTVTGLSPGKKYYFWARGRNSVGWGAWSPVTNITLLAGARVLLNNSWRNAVPYVKVNGVWRVVRPWVKYSGIWRESL